MKDVKHQHFKMTDKSVREIFYHRHQTAIFVAVFVTIILCAIIFIQLNLKQSDSQKMVVRKKAEKELAQNTVKNNYSQQVKILLHEYLSKRSADNFDCLVATPKMIQQVLNLTVPLHLKTFHLELVVLLDKENKNCETGLGELSSDWQKFLKKNEWLNK